MMEKLEIKVLDIRNISIDIKSITLDQINSLFGDDYNLRSAIINLNEKFKSPIFNFLQKSNIESINIRNLAVLDGIIPILSKTIRNSIVGVRFISNKLCIKNGKWVNIPENTDVNIRELAVINMDINMNLYSNREYNYEDFEVTDAKPDEKFIAAMSQVLDYYLSNAYNFINSSFLLHNNDDDFNIETNEIVLTEETGREYEKLKKLVKKIYNIDIKSTEQGLMLLGDFRLYYYVLTEGMESEKIKEFVEEKLAKESYLAKKLAANNKILAEQNREKLINRIAMEKFKVESLDKLSKTEQNIVMTEYEMFIGLIKNTQKNDCEHIRVMHDLNEFSSNENFARLTKIIDKSEDVYPCRHCKFSVICAHKYIKIQSDIEAWPYEKFENAMYKFLVPVGYINYCKVCGEEIMPVSRKSDIVIDSDNDSKMLIWKSVMQAFNLFTFKVNDNPRRLAQNAISIIMPQATSDMDCVVYSYAFVLDYYIESKNITLYGGKNKKSAVTTVSEIAKIMVNDLKMRHFDLIKEMTVVEADMINSDFLIAYKKLKGSSENTERDSVKELINNIVSSTNYQFACIIAIMDGKTPSFKLITGRTVDEYIKYCEGLIKNSKIIDIIRYHKYEDNMYFALKEFDPIQAYYETKGTSILHEAYKKYMYFLKDVDTNMKYNEYIKSLGIEKKLHNFVKFNGNQDIPMKTPFYKLENIKYSNIYDEDGNRHIWDGDECKICKINKFETDSLDNNKIIDVIKTKFLIEAFFVYYTYNCPVDKNHVVPCNKCGLKNADYKNPDMSYYDKYINDYTNIKYAHTNIKIVHEKPQQIQFIDYKYNHSNIIKVIDIMKTNTKSIHCIGLVSGIEYNKFNEDDIVTYTVQDSRFYIALSLFSRIIYLYSQMKNVLFLVDNIDSFLTDKKHSKLDNLDINYISICSNAITTVEKDMVMKFIHEHICKFIIFVYDQNKVFAKELFDHLIECNKSLSKPERAVAVGDDEIEDYDDIDKFDAEKDVLMDDNEINDIADDAPNPDASSDD